MKKKCFVCKSEIEEEDDELEHEDEIWCPDCFWNKHYVSDGGHILNNNEIENIKQMTPENLYTLMKTFELQTKKRWDFCTCYRCSFAFMCDVPFDEYNIDGECLREK